MVQSNTPEWSRQGQSGQLSTQQLINKQWPSQHTLILVDDYLQQWAEIKAIVHSIR